MVCDDYKETKTEEINLEWHVVSNRNNAHTKTALQICVMSAYKLRILF